MFTHAYSRATTREVLLVLAASFLTIALGAGLLAQASSHREAPMITADPKADATDLYAFVSPDNADNVVLIANYLPFQEPAGGPNFYSFDDSARYNINIDNDGDAVADIIYRFDFESGYENDGTFLYTTGPVSSLNDSNLNFRQTYTLTKIVDGVSEVLVTDADVPPSYIGSKTIPGDYENLQDDAITSLPGGGKAFAGQSEDSFFVDLGAAFDLLNVRELPGDDGGGVDALAGFNVLSLALEVPISDVTSDGSTPTDVLDPAAVIGVWTTSERQSTRVLNDDGTADYSGDWVQVSRLGQPLVNEVVIPVGMKDRFNASVPADDAQFANFVANPEFPTILNLLFGITVPPQGDFGTDDQRADLITIFLTGIPELNQPAGVTPSEQLRLNVAVPVTEDPNPLGVIAGDSQGFPNGRRLGDDVVDIALRAMAGIAYPLLVDDTYTPDPIGIRLGDGVDENDADFRNSFPYVGLPYNGWLSIPHEDAYTPSDNDDGDNDDDDRGAPSRERVSQAIERVQERVEEARGSERATNRLMDVRDQLQSIRERTLNRFDNRF